METKGRWDSRTAPNNRFTYLYALIFDVKWHFSALGAYLTFRWNCLTYRRKYSLEINGKVHNYDPDDHDHVIQFIEAIIFDQAQDKID